MTVGTKVRVREIASSLKRDLAADQYADLASMIGEGFEVYEIGEYGAAWVEKVWREPGGGLHSHSLALASHEMEVV